MPKAGQYEVYVRAFPDNALTDDILLHVARELPPSPIFQDAS